MSQEVIEVTEREVEIIEIVERGPAGPAGTGLQTLTTQGDMLYQGASIGQRLPIGTAGQVLKVNSGATAPEWANESGAVTSVNGQTGAVTVAVPSASSTTPAALGTAAVGSASTFARADHVHAMPTAANVGAAVNLEYLSISASSTPINLAANKQYTVFKTISGEIDLYLPEFANDGDRIVIRWTGGTVGGGFKIVRQGGNPYLQTIGRLRTTYSVFSAVWAGLWYPDFNPPSGLGLAPSTTSSDGIAGDLAYADPYLYVCVANNNWRRVPVAAW
jgi:hypothetical protein